MTVRRLSLLAVALAFAVLTATWSGSVAMAQELSFTPRIEVTAVVDPSAAFPGDTITVTYEVRNTGDVPLAGVASRFVGDGCSPITYVSGDVDGDGLLDTPTSIFDDDGDERWVFTCTTAAEQPPWTTVVTGTPTDPVGEPLCDDVACDVTGSVEVTPIVLLPGSLRVSKAASPADGTAFSFTALGESFALTAGQTRDFAGLRPGVYVVTEQVPPGWEVVRIDCSKAPRGGPVTTDLATATATVTLDAGQQASCLFESQRLPAVLPSTGVSGVQHLVLVASLAVSGGSVLRVLTRRAVRSS